MYCHSRAVGGRRQVGGFVVEGIVRGGFGDRLWDGRFGEHWKAYGVLAFRVVSMACERRWALNVSRVYGRRAIRLRGRRKTVVERCRAGRVIDVILHDLAECAAVSDEDNLRAGRFYWCMITNALRRALATFSALA